MSTDLNEIIEDREAELAEMHELPEAVTTEKPKGVIARIKYAYRDKRNSKFLGYAVDRQTREVKYIKSINPDQTAVLGDRIKVVDLPTDTNEYPYGEWQQKVFTNNIGRTTLIFSILFPFFFFVWLFVVLVFYPKPMIASPMMSVLLVLMYKILSSSSTKKSLQLRSHPSGDPYAYEAEWWSADHRDFPEESKKTKVIVVGKGDDRSLVETKEKYVFLDCRGEYVKIMPRTVELEVKPNQITGANIMSVASLKNSAYEFAKRRGKKNVMEKNMPYVAVIGISLIGLFFSSNRILTMLGLDG